MPTPASDDHPTIFTRQNRFPAQAGSRGHDQRRRPELLEAEAARLAAVATIGLGVGASTAVFSVFDAVLLRPLPYPDAERIVALWAVRPPDVVVFDLRLPEQRYEGAAAGAWFGELIERVSAIPEVENAGLTRNLPMSGRHMSAPVSVEGRAAAWV